MPGGPHAADRAGPAGAGVGAVAGATDASSTRPASTPQRNPLRADGSVDYRMWQKEWENTLQAARDELCIDKGFIIFLTGAALSSVLLFVFEAYLKIMDAP